MQVKKIFSTNIVSWLLLLVPLLGVFYLYANKGRFEKITQASYQDLYEPPADSLLVGYAIKDSNKVVIRLNTTAESDMEQWALKVDSAVSAPISGSPLVVTLTEGIHHYQVFYPGGKSLTTFTAEYYSRASKPGLAGYGKAIIYQANVLPNKRINSVASWQRYAGMATATERTQIRQWLKDSMGVMPGDAAFEKVSKIALFICKRTLPALGSPADSMLQMPLLRQFAAASNGAQIWCGHYANFLQAFLSEAGVVNRYIEAAQHYGSNGSVHIINEYYLPEEKQWAAIDLTSGNLAYMNSAANNRLLNMVEVKNLPANDRSVSILHFDGTSFKPVLLNAMPPGYFLNLNPHKELRYYYSTDMDSVYSFSTKLKRFFTGEAFYVIYSDSKIYDNSAFTIKGCLLFLFFNLLLIGAIRKLFGYK